MPCVIICQKPDGSVYVNSLPDDQAQQFEQDSVPAASLDEAMKMAKDVLSEGETAQQEGAEPAGEDAADGGKDDLPGAEGMPMATRDDQMAAGFARAKRGY